MMNTPHLSTFPSTFRGQHPLLVPDSDPSADSLPPPEGQQKPSQEEEMVVVGGKKIPVEEAERRLLSYERLESENRQLKSFRESAVALTSETDTGRLFDHAVNFLKGKGLSDADARAEARTYVQNVERSRGGQRQRPIEEADEQPEDPRDALLQQMQTRQDASDAELRALRAKEIERSIDMSVSAELDLGQDAKAMMEKFRKLNGDTSANTVRAEIKQQVVQNLRKRRDGSNSWSDRWIPEETSKAVQQVFDRFRAVIGDPAKLGRAPETESGDANLSFLSKPAVKAPANSRRVAEKDLDSYVDDTLLRGLASGRAEDSAA